MSFSPSFNPIHFVEDIEADHNALIHIPYICSVPAVLMYLRVKLTMDFLQ